MRLYPGWEWDSLLHKHLASAEVLVLLVGEDTLSRAYVRRELETFLGRSLGVHPNATSARRPVIPVLIAGCTAVPELLNTWQWLDFRQGPFERHVRLLQKAVWNASFLPMAEEPILDETRDSLATPQPSDNPIASLAKTEGIPFGPRVVASFVNLGIVSHSIPCWRAKINTDGLLLGRCGKMAQLLCVGCGRGVCVEPEHVAQHFGTPMFAKREDGIQNHLFYWCGRCRSPICVRCLDLDLRLPCEPKQLTLYRFRCPACSEILQVIPVLDVGLDEFASVLTAWVRASGPPRTREEAQSAWLLPRAEGIGIPVAPTSGQEWTNPVDGCRMVYVPDGPFVMGTSPTELANVLNHCGVPPVRHGEFADETPDHEVFVSGFWIGVHAITNEQFTAFLRSTKTLESSRPGSEERFHYERILTLGDGGEGYPVSLITWHEAAAYCAWAGGTLPSEAEWEKTARGSDGRSFPWGNDPDTKKANTFETSRLFPDGIKVDALPQGKSPYGCTQLAGNVSEWCADWFDPKLYATGVTRDPTGPANGIHKVQRGAATTKPLVFARTTCRDYASPNARPDFTGFRVVIRTRR